MRKSTFCICENKDADQLHGNPEADHRFCFRYIDSTIPLLSKSENFKPLAIFCSCTAWFVSDQVGNQNVGFLMTQHICSSIPYFRLTIGLENCLFHFQYIDNLEGVFVSSDKDSTGTSQLTKEMLAGFHRCCRHIKQTFDDARKIKVQLFLLC